MTRRVRIRFGKEGDLRYISHRDLVRAFERMLRRAGLALAMTQGFHPRPQMTFPAALALGVEARREVAEFVMVDPPGEQELMERLTQAAPPGLTIRQLQIRPPQAPKARVRALCYEVRMPDERIEPIRQGIAQWQAPTPRPTQPLDLPPDKVQLTLHHGVLHMRLIQEPPPPAKPQQVLAALGCDAPSQAPSPLVRSNVELVDEDPSAEL